MADSPASRPLPSVNIEQEMRQSYMDYAMSVIIGRALPDVRDGLKPVHRRVLYAMQDLGNDWNRPYKKSARVVGDVIGKYHPHGDSAVYDTLVRMAQDFSLRYPLIDGQGNFGSVDGDPPAAMRYTEVRMTRITAELLADIDRETVNFVPNYDDTSREPAVLPSKFPNLLVNGSSGIAVGMSTNVPPHNLGEVVSALLALIENDTLGTAELMEYVPGPDFPTGAFIHGSAGVRTAYETGRGVVSMRAASSIEENEKTGKTAIVVHAIPFQVNKAKLIERIAELVNEKRIAGIADLRDESDRDGMRIVIDLKRDGVPEVILNQLYKMTQLQESFGIILLAIVDGQPRLLSLKAMLMHFLEHRREVVRRRTAFDLKKAQERLHLLEGLKIALDNLDAVLAIVRAGRNPADVRQTLMDRFGLSATQAQAILDMRLQRLTQLEREKILAEHTETRAAIAELQGILASAGKIDGVIRQELIDVRERFGDARRTEILPDSGDPTDADLIVEEDVVVTISHAGYVKRNPVKQYRSQRRGGKGVVGAATREEDFVQHMFVSSTHDFLLFFSSIGKVYCVRVYEVPQGSRTSKGKALVNLLPLTEGEKISAFLPVREFQDGRFLVFATRRGQIKKTELMAYANVRRNGIIALDLRPDDAVIDVRPTDGSQDVLLSTRNGKAVRFAEDEVRATGRASVGVRGILLEGRDEVVSLEILNQQATILTVSTQGYGKRTGVDEYRRQSRAGKGIRTLRTTDKTGTVCAVRQVTDDDHLMMITDTGRIIRIRAADVRVIGRNTQGVKLFDVGADERVSSLALAADDDLEEEEAAVEVGSVENEGPSDAPQPATQDGSGDENDGT